jgi:hypothetical protein
MSKLVMPPYQFVDAQQYIEEHSSVDFDIRVAELMAEKEAHERENHRLAQLHLSMERRNNGIVEELQRQKSEREKEFEERIALMHKTEKECQAEIHRTQRELYKSFQEVEAVLVTHKKDRNHLKFCLEEKKEVEALRISMLAQRDKLTQELWDTIRELRMKADQFERERIEERARQREAQQIKLKQDVAEAKAAIDKEKIDTLKSAESDSKPLAVQVTKFQKEVVVLRDRYNRLLEEANELEMQLMESKLVTQLTKPDSNQDAIGRLQDERDRLEEDKIRARTKPEANNRRKATVHDNSMKKKKNELSGFRKLNAIKRAEMDKLRGLAQNIIEQRNALTLFMNETMASLRHEIAASYDQRGRPFRTSELILCHLNEGDDEVLGRQFAPNEQSGRMTASDQLKLVEVLYSRFSGVPPPRKSDEVVA